MIVDTMSLQEVGEAILKTAISNIPTIAKMIIRKERIYKRVIYSGLKERYDFQPLSFADNGIEFYICPYSKGKKDYKKYGLGFCLFAHVYYRGSNWYCLITWDYSSVQMYCDHFFERYIERHLKDDSLVNVDIVRRYFKETDYLTHNEFVEHPKYKNCIYTSTNIGVCCGEKVSKHILVYKTYIDLGTLTIGKKREAFDEGQKAFESVITNVWGIRETKDIA